MKGRSAQTFSVYFDVRMEMEAHSKEGKIIEERGGVVACLKYICSEANFGR